MSPQMPNTRPKPGFLKSEASGLNSPPSVEGVMNLTPTIEATTMNPSTINRATRLAKMIEAGSVSVPVQVRIVTKAGRQILPVTKVKIGGGVIEVTSRLDSQMSVQCFDDVTALDVFVDANRKPVFLQDFDGEIAEYEREKRDEQVSAAAVALEFGFKVWDVAHGVRPAFILENVASYSLIYDELFQRWAIASESQAQARQLAA